MKYLYFIGLVVLLGACSAHKVRCDAGLQPINAPAAAGARAHKGAAPAPGSRP